MSAHSLSSSNFANIVASLRDHIETSRFGLLGVHCTITHQMCLSEEDVGWILSSWSQLEYSFNEQQFDPLFPSSTGTNSKNNDLTEDLLSKIYVKLNQVKMKSNKENYEELVYQTERLYPFIVQLLMQTKFNKTAHKTNRFAQESSTHDHPSTTGISNEFNSERKLMDPTTETNNFNCSNDFSKLSQLANMEIMYPEHLELVPPFHGSHAHYHINQSATSSVITLKLAVAHCAAWIRLEQQYLYQFG